MKNKKSYVDKLAKIAINKSLLKEYSNSSDERIVYMNDGTEFQIQLFNPYDLEEVKMTDIYPYIEKKGLLCEFDLPNTTLGDNVLESVKRGDLRGMSIGFWTKTDEWSHDDNDNYTRTIKEVDKLFDVSLVAMPAYDKTSVDLRSVALTNDPKPEPKKAEACEEYFMRKRDEIFG